MGRDEVWITNMGHHKWCYYCSTITYSRKPFISNTLPSRIDSQVIEEFYFLFFYFFDCGLKKVSMWKIFYFKTCPKYLDYVKNAMERDIEIEFQG